MGGGGSGRGCARNQSGAAGFGRRGAGDELCSGSARHELEVEEEMEGKMDTALGRDKLERAVDDHRDGRRVEGSPAATVAVMGGV